MNTPTTGRPVLLHTKHFLLRSLKPSYASQRWLSWLKDPEVMDPLNAPVREVPFRDLMAHIATADDNKLYMIGIFDLESKVQIGYYNIVCEIDQAHRRANFNVVIGEKSWWGKDVINETRAALLDEFFNNRGIEKATGNPLARNFPAIFNYKSQGWRHEGTLRAHSISVRDGSPLDQYLFGLSKDEWFGSAKKSPNPQRCEATMPMDDAVIREMVAATNGPATATMPMDDAVIREMVAAANGPATITFWKTDGAEFTINIQSIKGIDKAIAAVR